MISTKNLLLSFLGVGAIGSATVAGYYAFNKEETSNKVTESKQPTVDRQNNSLSSQQPQQQRALAESASIQAGQSEPGSSLSSSATTSVSNAESTVSAGTSGVDSGAK